MKKKEILSGIILLACLAAGTCTWSSELMVNPIKESSEQEIFETLGIELIPFEGTEDVTYTIISGEVGEMDFHFEGKEYYLRAENTEKKEAYDISGLYYEWEEDGEQTIGDFTVFFNGCKEAAVAYWLDEENGVDYTLGHVGKTASGELYNIVEKYVQNISTESGIES